MIIENTITALPTGIVTQRLRYIGDDGEYQHWDFTFVPSFPVGPPVACEHVYLKGAALCPKCWMPV